MKNQLFVKIKTFRSDSGGKYLSFKFQKFLSQHSTGCLVIVCWNRIERLTHTHSTYCQFPFSCIPYSHSHVPHGFWAEAILTLVYLINWGLPSVLYGLTTFYLVNTLLTHPPMLHRSLTNKTMTRIEPLLSLWKEMPYHCSVGGLEGLTPFESFFFSLTPACHDLPHFVCTCFILIPKCEWLKLSPGAVICVHLIKLWNRTERIWF